MISEYASIDFHTDTRTSRRAVVPLNTKSSRPVTHHLFYFSFGGIRHLLRRRRRPAQKAKKNGSVPSSDPGMPAPPERKNSLDKKAAAARRDSEEGEGRLSRWFSLRKSSHYDISERSRSLAKMTSVST